MKFKRFLDALFNKLLSPKTKEKSEQAILWIALGSFITHLIIIGLVHFNIIYLAEPSNLLKNPIAAIYTPFSFILVYEVYLLIYYLPNRGQVAASRLAIIKTGVAIELLFKAGQNILSRNR